MYITVDGENYSPALYDLLASDGLRTDSASNTAYVAVDEGNVDVSVSVFNFDNDSPGSITGGGIAIQFVPYNSEALGLVISFSVSEAFIQAEQAMIEEGSE